MPSVCPIFTSGQAQPFSRSAMQPPWFLPAPLPQSQRSRDECLDGSPGQSVQPGLGTTASALAARHMALERLLWLVDALGRAGLYLVSPLGDPRAKKQLGLYDCVRYPSFALCFPYVQPVRTAGRSCRQPSPRKLVWAAQLLLASVAPDEGSQHLLGTPNGEAGLPVRLPAYGGRGRTTTTTRRTGC